MFANFQTEMAGKGTPETNLQKAMAAVAALPMLIAVYNLQMCNFPNIGRSIVKISDLKALDLAKVEMVVQKLHDFEQLVVFKAELLLPDITNLYFIRPDQTRLQ